MTESSPTNEERWVAFCEQMLEFELRLDRLFETLSTLHDNQKGMIALIQIIADREY